MFLMWAAFHIIMNSFYVNIIAAREGHNFQQSLYLQLRSKSLASCVKSERWLAAENYSDQKCLFIWRTKQSLH